MGTKKPAKAAGVPNKVLARAKAAAVVPAAKPPTRVEPNERKAKVVAALKRLHPMD